MSPRRTVWTVGHSNIGIDALVALLRSAGIESVVDVRSQPYSRFAPQFNREALQAALANHGIRYAHLETLGGQPRDAAMYDSAGHVLYGALASSPEFQLAITELEGELTTNSVAIMCGEEDPTECHRRLLIGRVLQARGWAVDHIRGDGTLMPEGELADYSGVVEEGLFEEGEFAAWRSTRSVLPRNQPNSSSDY